MLKNIITFEQSAKIDILNFFNKVVDADKYVVEKEKTTQRVLTTEGEEVKIAEFAGIRKGSEIFIKSDLISLLKLADTFK